MPTIPQALAGQTMEPLVSVPTASGVSPAATATAEPELDPDGLRPDPYGFSTWPPSVLQPLVETVERKLAHSDRFALPRITAPAWRSRPTQNASPDSAPDRAGDPAVAGIPRTAMLSLTRTGIPASGPACPRWRRAWSLAAASPAARGFTEITARSSGFSRAIRSR